MMPFRASVPPWTSKPEQTREIAGLGDQVLRDLLEVPQLVAELLQEIDCRCASPGSTIAQERPPPYQRLLIKLKQS